MKKQDVRAKLDDLPLHLHLRLALLSSTEKEWRAGLVSAGRDPAAPFDFSANVLGFLSYYEASDGVEFLVDHIAMDVWFRTGKDPWVCALSHLYVLKTFGAIHPELPVCYVGERRFLIAETLPGKVRHEGVSFATADCVTFLVDCDSGRVLERSAPVPYDHSPPMVLPVEWEEKHSFRVERNVE